jgi:hypothetical protein
MIIGKIYQHLPFKGPPKFTQFFLKSCLGWGANPGPLNFIYFLIFHHFTAEPQRLKFTQIGNFGLKTNHLATLVHCGGFELQRAFLIGEKS